MYKNIYSTHKQRCCSISFLAIKYMVEYASPCIFLPSLYIEVNKTKQNKHLACWVHQMLILFCFAHLILSIQNNFIDYEITALKILEIYPSHIQ